MNRVTVIIPNYNGKKFIYNCMECLLKQEYKAFNVLIIDNGSTDNSGKMALEYADRLNIELVELGKNFGFPKAVNEGIKRTEAEYVILLNNDAYADEKFVLELVKKMDENPECFSAQALMLQEQNRNLVDGAGDYFSALGWGFARGKDKEASLYVVDREVFSSCAGAAIYRRNVFDEIGLFDESFFAYLEDMDVGYRARLYGYKNVLAVKAKVYHVGSGSSGSRHNGFKVKLSARNSFLVMYKNFAWWQWVINIPLIGIGYLTKVVFFARKKLAREYIKGVREFKTHKTKVVRTHKTKLCMYIKVQKQLFINSFLRMRK